MKYRVTYQETLSRTFVVDADDENDAIDKMYNAVCANSIVLYCNDCSFNCDVADEFDENVCQSLDKIMSN